MSQRAVLNCLKFSLVATLLLILQPVFSQTKKSTAPSLFPDLESAIEPRRKDLGGDLMVYVANRDTVVYQKAFGDVNNRTQAPAGAASTWFTTALVLQLVDEGKISLDDKVTQYLPVYGSYYKSYITVRHCLTNTTGIKAEPFKTANVHEMARFASLEEEVANYAKIDIAANAGDAYNYNGMGTNIAARIVEIVTKKKFEQLMRQRIFTPLGMRNSTFASDDGSAPNPAFGAKTTAADFIRFLQMILNNGVFAGKQILSEKAVAEMRKIQVESSRMNGVSKAFAGLEQTLGVWAIEGSEKVGASASALVYPSLTGVWPMVDFSRGYAFVLLPKTFTGEQNSNVYMGLKQVFDEKWKGRKNDAR
ncbi:serine hydrolase domain-containing protein [Flavisolibacter ginsenosidimutans]|nr:serine hydrolase [Flavisolibacter ginsenosidimutans]